MYILGTFLFCNGAVFGGSRNVNLHGEIVWYKSKFFNLNLIKM